MELSTYFRINAENKRQFERLIIADKGPMFLPGGLHGPSGIQHNCTQRW